MAKEKLPCENCDIIAETTRRLFQYASPGLRDRKVLESVAQFQKDFSTVCVVRECKRTVLPPITESS